MASTTKAVKTKAKTIIEEQQDNYYATISTQEWVNLNDTGEETGPSPDLKFASVGTWSATKAKTWHDVLSGRGKKVQRMLTMSTSQK